MKGLELAAAYYEAYGKEMLSKEFPALVDLLAVGLAGSGSECYGYDDEISRDHDFEPSFCIFLPEEALVDRRSEFLLERAYAKLPKEFMGIRRSGVEPVGGRRRGVIRMEEFFMQKVGSPDGRLSLEQWLTLPEYGLLEATNGAVFSDPLGLFCAIRERLKYFPEDVRRKKLAGYLLLMGQSGQYNYPRCLGRGDEGAAQLALFEFVKSALHVLYLLNRAYMPYYKWSFRALAEVPFSKEVLEKLKFLLCGANTEEERTKKRNVLEEVCAVLGQEVYKRRLTNLDSSQMERLAYAVNDTISDPSVRTLHILQGV